MMKVLSRMERLRSRMLGARLDAMIVTHAPDVQYLCGFTGSSGALLIVAGSKRASALLFTDGRYSAQARAEVRGAAIRIVKKAAATEACVALARTNAGACGFDTVSTSVASLSSMRTTLRAAGRSPGLLKPTAGLIAELRQIKYEPEIQAIRRAAALTSTLYESMLSFIDAGMREIDVAAEMEHRARLAGAEGMSFETIVASGTRSSLPHGRATTSRLCAGDLLTLDFGIILDGYCSDMTRTVYLGFGERQKTRLVQKKEAEARRVFDTVLEAQVSAISAVGPGVPCWQVDAAARSVLQTAGLAQAFTHSTGHGLGLEIHEGPRLAAKQEGVLRPGMVITIEPGAYLPDTFGVRIEDTVLVTDTGCDILTPAFKGWTEL